MTNDVDTPKCDCGKTCEWVYGPSYEGNENPYYCDDCVPRGCSCNYEYILGDFPSYPPTDEPDGSWRWVEDGEEDDVCWEELDDGRPYPCCEFMYLSVG